ncbi:2-oxoisovalerate dehydrogenase E2 component (dihydrolipoyl transacylase) [Sphingopyxis sp. OAS728]|uniref:dihydrolipoamide acetyltransferase family protein n=1 Tax=Sphingopyxis sp. OAS728 TaxID=2663823 RepID=UPI00178BAC12|nr:dihydrolipoamide acetyltransferase family protein [Sphingopyxis sp. OAS728]MBE1525793.1 2-oxoisovalerate dehydrogenase E2 component (dihydrolipoyl transacylase) [Sphingopyxis sp. OAS728]
MARYSFRLPDIGEGIAEAEIVAWHVKIGERVEEDAQLADMMTDKATVEMESPVSGIVVELAGEVGDLIPIGSTLAVIETDGAEEDGGDVEAPPADTPVEREIVAETPGAEEISVAEVAAPAPAAAPAPTPAPAPAPAPVAAADHSRAVLASPAVRARAKDLGVDLGQVQAEGDRIRHSDLDAFLRYSGGQGYHAPGASRARADEPIKVIGMRRKIAENMAASKRAIPHFTYVEEMDVTALEDMRADLNANRGGRPKLTMLPFLIVAICRTIPQFPMINARYDDEGGVVTRYGAVHLGMATQTDAGLMVPVIRDAQDKNVWQLASEITRLAEAARTGKAKVEELTGGTLTVTSLGPLGGIATTPVINRPEVAIIGPNKIVERPVFDGDEIRRAKLMNLSISCDHRVVDGWDAASYVQALKKLIETPVLLFAD